MQGVGTKLGTIDCYAIATAPEADSKRTVGKEPRAKRRRAGVSQLAVGATNSVETLLRPR